MALSNAQARQDLLDALGEAADEIGHALSALGAAYEQLDETTGDRLEEALFRPVQAAYGRVRRTHSEFAGRVGLPTREFVAPGAAHGQARAHVDEAVEALRRADDRLSVLQDSMLPVEFGDRELRAGLAEVRAAIGVLPGRARELTRTLGR